jgi:hypothetical protein
MPPGLVVPVGHAAVDHIARIPSGGGRSGRGEVDTADGYRPGISEIAAFVNDAIQ